MPVDLVGPDGKQYVLTDPAELSAALEAGYREETAEAPQTFGEQAKSAVGEGLQTVGAAVEGGLRGFAPGLTGEVLGGEQRGGETPEDFARRKFDADQMNKRREEHPFAAFAGELSGAIVSPLSKIAPVQGVTAIGRIGAGMANYGVQGGLYGAGNAIDEAALGNTDLSAEKLIAGAGLGALLGLAGGGIGGALEEGIRVAGPAIGKAASRASDSLAEFANDRWLKAAGGIKGSIKKIPMDEHPLVANAIRDHLKPLGGIDDALISAQAERVAIGQQVLKDAGVADAGGLLPHMAQEDAQAAIEIGFKDFNAKKLAVLDTADKAGAFVDFREMGARLNKLEYGLSPLKREALAPELKAARRAIEEYEKKGGGFRALDEFRQDLQAKAKWDNNLGQAFNADLKRQLAGVIRDEVDSQLAPQVGSQLAKDFLDSKRALGILAEGEKALGRKTSTGADAIKAMADKAGLATPEVARFGHLGHAENLFKAGIDQKGNRWASPSDYAVGIAQGLLHGTPGGILVGLASAVGHKVLREKGAGIIAALSDKIAASPALKLTAASFAAKMQTAAPQFGKWAPMMAQALAHSPAVALATHMTWGSLSPEYEKAAGDAGFLPETPEEHGFAMSKTQGLVGIAAHLSATDEKINAGIEKVFKGGGSPKANGVLRTQDFGSKAMRRETTAAHKQRMDEIRALAADPSALLERVSANLGGIGAHAPGMSAAATAVAHRAVTYLASQIQEPPQAGPLAPKWVFSDAQVFAFGRKLEAVQDPLSILRHAWAGTLTRDQVEAVGAVVPTVLAQIRDTALQRMTDSPKGVPYGSRLMLETLTGIDPDGSLGMAVALNQQAISNDSQRPSEQLGSSNEASGKLTVAQDFATPQQKKELERKNG